MRSARQVMCVIALAAVVAAGASRDELIALARRDDVRALRALVDGGDVALDDRERGSGQTALMAASLAGSANAVKELLSLGASPNIGEKDGYTPHHGAAFQGRPAVTRALLAGGVRARRQFHRDGFTPLHRAAWGDSLEHALTVRALVEEGGEAVDVRARGGERARRGMRAALARGGGAPLGHGRERERCGRGGGDASAQARGRLPSAEHSAIDRGSRASAGAPRARRGPARQGRARTRRARPRLPSREQRRLQSGSQQSSR